MSLPSGAQSNNAQSPVSGRQLSSPGSLPSSVPSEFTTPRAHVPRQPLYGHRYGFLFMLQVAILQGYFFVCLLSLSGVKVRNVQSSLCLVPEIVRGWEGAGPSLMSCISSGLAARSHFSVTVSLMPCRPASLSTLAILNSAWKAVEARSKQRSKSAGGILSAQSLPPSTTNSKKGRKERLLWTDSVVLAWVWLTQHGCLAHEVSECFYSYFLVICSFFSKRESAVYWSTHSCGGPCNQHTRT